MSNEIITYSISASSHRGPVHIEVKYPHQTFGNAVRIRDCLYTAFDSIEIINDTTGEICSSVYENGEFWCPTESFGKVLNDIDLFI